MSTSHAQQPATLTFPRPFGKYTLLHRLATGGMAELFLALHRSTAGFEKLVVIKRALPIVNHEETFISMLLHEARVAATLSHPNIVQIYDVGQIEGTHFIAMEHIHGEDLRAIQRHLSKDKGVLPLEHALYVAIALCSGLSYAHDKCDLAGNPLRIVHRDISPHNVIVSYSGDVKLVDFGVAKSRVQLADQTRAGNIKGKVAYMSPEQALGHAIDARSDVFAIGSTLYELTTGRRAFRGRNDYETMRLVGAAAFELPGVVKRDYPPDLEAILMRTLTRYPEDRYQSARELQIDLERFVHAAHLHSSALSLSAFMHRSFGDKLRRQDEMLASVKLVADSALIDQSQPFHSDVAPAPSHRSSPPEVSVSDIAPREKRGGWGWLGFAAAIAVFFFGLSSSEAWEEVKVSKGSWYSFDDGPSGTHLAPPAGGSLVGFQEEIVPGPTGRLSITASGAGCELSVDGKPTGHSPIWNLALAPGTHAITCTASPRRTLAINARVDPGQSAQIGFVVPEGQKL